MGFTSIRTYQFRNLADTEIPVDCRDVYLIGENGQGKTNFIEAVYLLCYGTSFRTKIDRHLISHEKTEMSVSGRYRVCGEENTVSVSVTEKEKRIRLNGKQVKDRKELIGSNPCILFSHDDMELVQGSPEKRRFFFNQTMTLVDTLFVDVLRSYSRLLKLRNCALKERQNDLIDVYDEQIATVGFEIQRRRSETVAEFNRTFSPLFGTVSGLSEGITIRYAPSLRDATDARSVCDELKKRREVDIAFGTTTAGPHRDRFSFLLGRRNFTELASTGQIRLTALALKAAQGMFFREKTGRNPILLLDDVLLELDRRKREAFLSLLPAYEQAFYTFLPNEEIVNTAFSTETNELPLQYRVHHGSCEVIWKKQEIS